MATVFEKTWQFDINRAPSDNTTVLLLSKSLVWYLKAFLTGQQGGAASGLWSCYYSCDSATAGTAADGVDRWGGGTFDGTKIVRAAAGVAHSWFVLKSPSIASPFGSTNWYCIIDFSGSADNTPINLVFSKAAPTGGTTTARPTSTDEWTHAANSQLNDNTNGAMKFHGLLATDGNFVLFASKTGSGLSSFGIIFQVLSNPGRTGDLYPVATFIGYSTSATGPFDCQSNGLIVNTVGAWRMRLFDGSSVSTTTTAGGVIYNTSSMLQSLSYQAAKTDFTDGDVGDAPVYLLNNDASKASKRGRLADICFIVGNPAQGATEPPAGPPASMVVGGLWLPTNTAPIF